MKKTINELVQEFPQLERVYLNSGKEFLVDSLENFDNDIEARNEYYSEVINDINEKDLYVIFTDYSNDIVVNVKDTLNWHEFKDYAGNQNQTEVRKAYHVYQELHDEILGYND